MRRVATLVLLVAALVGSGMARVAAAAPAHVELAGGLDLYWSVRGAGGRRRFRGGGLGGLTSTR